VTGVSGLKATPILNAWGLRGGGTAWQDRAACADGHDPEMWHAAGESRIDWHQLGRAAHICWAHCPVRRECYDEYRGMRGAVVGGVFFNGHGNRSPLQPHATGCDKCQAGEAA